MARVRNLYVGYLLLLFSSRHFPFHSCWLLREAHRVSSDAILRLFFSVLFRFPIESVSFLVLRDCPCRHPLIRLVIRIGWVSCFHVIEPIIPALEPSIPGAYVVLVDVFIRLVCGGREC
ncbi:hypothetical protein Bca4012_026446 [Brassica carinata]